MNSEMIPQYSTVLFTDVWNKVENFMTDFKSNGIPYQINNVQTLSDTNAQTLFYLLYARYGNNPIANRDINQWKFKVFSIIFQYGPTWQKRLDIQAKLRGLTDDEILLGAKSIFNHAFNPSTEPSTGSLSELTYINDQNVSNYKKSKMDAYAELWDLLKVDITEEFLSKFKHCFKLFVSPEQPLLYVSDYSDEEA